MTAQKGRDSLAKTIALSEVQAAGNELWNTPVTHMASMETYYIRGTVIREHDLVPCFLYAKKETPFDTYPATLWCRPISEFFAVNESDGSPRWTWEIHNNVLMQRAHDKALIVVWAKWEG